MDATKALRALYTDYAEPLGEQPVFDSAESAAGILNDSDRHDALRRLYEQGKAAQWDVHGALDWATEVDPGEHLFDLYPGMEQEPWYKRLTMAERRRLTRVLNVHTVSQFTHGEKAALFATSQLVTAVRDLDDKFCVATQAMDEARHVEAFEKYGKEKLGGLRPITGNLFSLFEAITDDARPDFRVLGMQLLVEGVGLAALMQTAPRCREPLLRNIMWRVLADEARHVSYGLLTLRDRYAVMPEPERRARQEFVHETLLHVRDRLVSTEPFESLGISADEVGDYFRRSGMLEQFRTLVFANIVPGMERIGLLDGYLAERFAEMGVLELRDVDVDTLLERGCKGMPWGP